MVILSMTYSPLPKSAQHDSAYFPHIRQCIPPTTRCSTPRLPIPHPRTPLAHDPHTAAAAHTLYEPHRFTSPAHSRFRAQGLCSHPRPVRAQALACAHAGRRPGGVRIGHLNVRAVRAELSPCPPLLARTASVRHTAVVRGATWLEPSLCARLRSMTHPRRHVRTKPCCPRHKGCRRTRYP
jgi:hypothetical protein